MFIGKYMKKNGMVSNVRYPTLPYPTLTTNPPHRTATHPTPHHLTRPLPPTPTLHYPTLPYPTLTPNQPHPTPIPAAPPRPAPHHTTTQPQPLPPTPYPLPYPSPTPPNPYLTPVLPYTDLPCPTIPYPTLPLYMQVRSDVSVVLLSISISKFSLVLSVRSVSFRSVKLKAIGTDRMNSVKSVDSMPELSKLYNC